MQAEVLRTEESTFLTQHYVKLGPKVQSFTILTIAHDLIHELHQLCGSLISKFEKKHLGPKAEVLKGVSFFRPPVVTVWVVGGQRETFWPALVQSDLWGFRLLCLGAVKKLSFMLKVEGS